MPKFLFLIILSSTSIIVQGQSSIYDIFITQDSASGYTILNWEVPLTLPHSIKRKSINENEWTVIDSSFTGIQFVDTSSVIGQAFEYRITHFDKATSSTHRYTFAYAGFEIHRVTNRGRILILVDSLHAIPLQEKIDRWKIDVEGDGWAVMQKNVSQSTTSENVKELIKEEYDSELGLEAVFLFGHIPVPYSGNIWPDGHIEHLGPWPADVYYGEMDETWSDTFLDENHFSKSFIEDAEIQIGRVDFNDMPAFEETELELLENYLDKNHAFRQKHFTPNMQATYKDNFNRGFDLSVKRNFPTMVGIDNSSEGNYRNDLLSDSYIWSYGAGSGTFTSAGGISNTATMSNDSLQGVFTMLFGSFFGDWDNTNNYLRSALGSGTILTNCWGNRPSWVLFHMGLGTNIGYQTKLTQADRLYNSVYSISGFRGMLDTLEVADPRAGSIHTALLGDPSLRMHMTQPIASLTAIESTQDDTVELMWTYDGDPNTIEGFSIYKKPFDSTYFQFIEKVTADVLSYIDTTSNSLGIVKYMVRPENLEITPSGSFYNQATGLQVEINITVGDMDNDGFTNIDDCDDNNPNINPDQTEEPYNGIDDDCNSATPDDDLDQDGFLLADDCDDTNPNINTAVAENPYNGIDDDCDPLTPDDDLDGDGFNLADDCDDTNPDVNTAVAENPYNGIDDDCDPMTPDDDLDGDGFNLADDCDDTNPNINTAVAETPYNGIDDDCDPLTPDDDLDGDGFNLVDDCDDTNPNINTAVAETPYNGIDDDCDPMTPDDDLDGDGFNLADDCDDTNPNINTAVAENPYNGIDDDCDPLTPDDDLDGDGFNLADDCDDTNPNINTAVAENPYNGIDDDCDPMTPDDDLDGDGFNLADDCDDTNPDVNTAVAENPYNGIDDDCDPLTPDDDLDGDGFNLADDCDDTNSDVNPNGIEIPNNGIDENCDGMDGTVSTKNIEIVGLKIYPNPVSEFLNIDAPANLEYSVRLFDLTGRLIFYHKNIQKLNVQNLAEGAYLLEVLDLNSARRTVERVVVMK